MASTPSKDAIAPAGNLTQHDFNLLLAAFQSTKSEFVLDNTKFAEKGGFANANSARVAWHGLKKKLNQAAGVDVFNGKASDGASKDDGEAGEETGKKAKGKGKKAKAETEDAGEGDVAKPTKGRKRKTPTTDAEEEGEQAKPKAKKGKKGKKAAADDDLNESVEAEDGVKSEPEE